MASQEPKHRTLHLTKLRPLRFGLRRVFVWFTVVAAVLGAFVWVSRLHSVTIDDARISVPNTCEIGRPSDQFITGLTAIVSGEIDGQATISLDDYGRVHKIGPGQFELDISPHEFYSSHAKVFYSPTNVSNGHVVIKYKFY